MAGVYGDYWVKFESNKFPEATKQFRRPRKVLEWLESEAEYWDWLNGTGIQQASQAYQKIQKALSEPTNNLRHAFGQNNEQLEADFALEALNRVARSADTNSFIPSRSELSVHINEVKEFDPQIAGAMAFVAMTNRTDNLPNSRIVIEAVANIRIFERGVTSSTATATATQVARTKFEFDRFVETSKAQAEDIIGEFVETTKNKVTAYKRSRTILARWIADQRKNTRKEQIEFEDQARSTLNSAVEESKKKIENFTDFYENKIALAEPANYWDSKRITHRRATVVLGAVFLIYGLSISKLLYDYLSSEDADISAMATILLEQPLAALTLLIVAVTLALIISRIIYRLFLSQLHLWNDAAERVTMIKTYLALASRDHAKEEHLIALTNRLFAPASDGVVKDDFGSVSVFDLLANKMK